MKHTLMFEVIPPSKTASEKYTMKFTDKLVHAIETMPDVTILNVPEIVEENHAGLPYYRNVDTRLFGSVLRERCKKDVLVNTVVVYYDSKESFEQWLGESIEKYGITHYVFVGGKIAPIHYPGPSVIESNKLGKTKGACVGNICIPDRPGEAKRLFHKTKAGCDFFTTQVLFEPDTTITVLNEYAKQCQESNITPAKLFLSFSPLSKQEDIEFLRWLGAVITDKTERRLTAAASIGEESVSLLGEVARTISERVPPTVPLGFNVECITLHNLELATELVHALVDEKLLKG